jgi:hypothetical protein
MFANNNKAEQGIAVHRQMETAKIASLRSSLSLLALMLVP